MRKKYKKLPFPVVAPKHQARKLPDDNVSVLLREKTHDKGKHIKRIEYCNREFAFAEHWIEENYKISWLNQGQGLLQNLFMEGKEPPLFTGLWATHIITRRERMITATVIQWLGTNCGWCFLEECLKKCGYRIVKIK